MVKADKLIKEQIERDERKKITFDKVFLKIEKKIILASAANYYYCWYSIPEFIVGLPMYSLKECKEFIEIKLKKDGFKTEFFEPNIVLVNWFPEEKSKDKLKNHKYK
jgi:hypothetical protein